MSKEEKDQENFEPTRRPNPKGWIPPKAPYNPYDPTDLRPTEGYPSEFSIPGNQPSGFSSIPKAPTQYARINETMRRLNYTPRPPSELYPGQYKVLRKVDTYQRLNTGSRYFGTLVGGSIFIYFMFFHRWNEGHETIVSDLYRARLRLKERFFDLNDIEYQDLHHPKGANIVLRNVPDAQYIPDHMRKTVEGDYALNRPAARHVLEADRLQQEKEENLLRDLDNQKHFLKNSVPERDDSYQENKESNKKSWFF